MNEDNQQNYWQTDQAEQPAAGQSADQQPDNPRPESENTTPEAPLKDHQNPVEDEVESEDQAEDESASEPFQPVRWEASEYIHHERDALWVIGFIVVTAGFIALAVFIFKSYTFAVLLVVMAAALAIYAKRAPKVVKYTLSAQGLHIDQKFHSFSDFRGFGVLHDGALYSVLLLPTARFAPSTHIYFSEGDGEQIVDIFASFLPAEDVRFDMVDSLMRRLRL